MGPTVTTSAHTPSVCVQRIPHAPSPIRVLATARPKTPVLLHVFSSTRNLVLLLVVLPLVLGSATKTAIWSLGVPATPLKTHVPPPLLTLAAAGLPHVSPRILLAVMPPTLQCVDKTRRALGMGCWAAVVPRSMPAVPLVPQPPVKPMGIVFGKNCAPPVTQAVPTARLSTKHALM